MEEVIRGKLGLGAKRAEADRVQDERNPAEAAVWEGPVLHRVRCPADLKPLSKPELRKLCIEIREVLNEQVARRGHDIDATLGVVELTVALESLLDLPTDRLVWDTGHQTMAHKILTGRLDEIGSMGEATGPAACPTRDESPFDSFGTGHASTAISAVLGMATARDLSHEDYRTVAVIGDGAMSGGLAYEAMNNAGQSKRRMLVVLNDNGHSFSPRVGSIAQHLTSIRTNPHVKRLRDESFHLIERLPALGESVGTLAKRMEQAVKAAIVPGALYEALGFNYIGPIDGNDLDALLEILPRVVDRERPTLLHVLTKRGQGRTEPIAEIQTDEKQPEYSQVFADAMNEAGEAFPNMVAIVASAVTGAELGGYRKRFPHRYFDVGIAESHGICFAAGLACDGARPVATISSSCLQRAYDQIVNDVANQKLPVVFAQEKAGLVGKDGKPHHGAFDLSYMRCIPNLTLAAPKDGNELRDLLWTALSHTTGPFALRYPATKVPANFAPNRSPRVLPVGSWERLYEGRNASILAVGSMVDVARDARDLLAKEGIEVGLINCRFIKPLDLGMLRQLRAENDHLFTVEENSLLGGFGDGVLEALNDDGLSTEGVHRHGLPDRFMDHGSRADLLEKVELTPNQLASSIRSALK